MPESTKLIVNITSQAHNAMNRAADLTGLTRTDVVSLALSLYAHVMETPDGGDLAFQKPDGAWRRLWVGDHQRLPVDAEIVEV